MDIKKHILNQLLDKYENSMHYQGKAKVNRKIALALTPQILPWYWDSDRPHLKQAVHEVVEELAGEGILLFKWQPFEKGNLLESVWLNLENVNFAYQVVGRKPKIDKVQEAIKELEILLPAFNQDWIKKFLGDCLEHLRGVKDFPTLWPVTQEERDLLRKALTGLEDKKDQVLLERVFSLKYLGNSKILQREVKGRLARIAGQYLLKNAELSEDEILLELGIERISEEVLVSGPISFLFGDREVDYSIFPFGGVIDTKCLPQIEISSLKANKIITIENKANFHYLVSRNLANDSLLVYLGGFPGPRKRNFLAALHHVNPAAPFYHWGDIDLGGFRIFAVLRRVVPELKPLNMDEATLIRFKDYSDELEDNYSKQLAKLLDKLEYEMFWPVVRLMLKEKIRLEQEALLVEEVT